MKPWYAGGVPSSDDWADLVAITPGMLAGTLESSLAAAVDSFSLFHQQARRRNAYCLKVLRFLASSATHCRPSHGSGAFVGDHPFRGVKLEI